MSTSNIPDLEEFEAEIFFGKETAIAGKCALVTAGFDIESLPSVDGFDDVWLVARACCDRGADVYDLVRTVEALMEPHAGMIWTLGTCSEDEPRWYEMMSHKTFVRTEKR